MAQADRLHRESLTDAVVRDPMLSDYFAEVAARIAGGVRKAAPGRAQAGFVSQIQAHLVDSDVVNVFTTGGRHVYVYNGLFQFCRSEEELAAALAHAWAHAVNFDVEALDLQPDPAAPLRAVAYSFVTSRFTEAQERAADELAFDIYVRAGWDPARYPTLFARLSDDYPQQTADDRPAPGERSAAAQAAARAAGSDGDRQPPVADPRTFADLRRRARDLAEARPPVPPEQVGASVVLMALPNCLLDGDLPEQVEAQQRLEPPPVEPVRLEPN